MTIRLEVGRVSACPVAGCADLVQARQEASSRYALLTRAPQREIEECARRAMTALAGRPSLRATLETRLRTVIDSSGKGLRLRARETILLSGGLFRALSVHSRGAQLLGAAQGAQLVARSGRLVIQTLCADDYVDRQQAALICMAGRWSCFLPQVAGPGGGFSHRRLVAARALGAAAVALDIAEADEDAGLRRHLDAAAEALHAMQVEGAGLPESLAEWRQFMLNELDAEIFVYELLMTEYAATDCKIAD